MHPPSRRTMLVTGLFVAALAVAPGAASASADRGATAFAASACGSSPLCSVPREPARLSVRGSVAPGLTTNAGPRNVSENEVNSRGQSWLSGCMNNFCVLYWVAPDGLGRYANLPRSNVAVRRPRDTGPWVSAVGRGVRRLGGPPSRRRHQVRKLIAGPALNEIFHPTHGGRGRAALSGYSCTDPERGCNYVSAADAPPNTSQGGKGLTSGVFRSGTTFYATDLTHRIPVFRKDKNGAWGMARWVYGFIRWRGGRVWCWVIESVRIKERNGRVTTYPGYLR